MLVTDSKMNIYLISTNVMSEPSVTLNDLWHDKKENFQMFHTFMWVVSLRLFSFFLHRFPRIVCINERQSNNSTRDRQLQSQSLSLSSSWLWLKITSTFLLEVISTNRYIVVTSVVMIIFIFIGCACCNCYYCC